MFVIKQREKYEIKIEEQKNGKKNEGSLGMTDTWETLQGTDYGGLDLNISFATPLVCALRKLLKISVPWFLHL